MSDTPEQIIEGAIWSTLEAQEEPVGGPWVDRDMRMIDSSGSEVNMTAAVSAALAALKDARYHVVKLPEPAYVDDPEGDGVKGYGYNGDPALSDHGVYAHGGRVFDQYDGWTPAQARTIASWWLAAADSAEAKQ